MSDGELKYADVPMPSVRDALPQTPAIVVTRADDILTRRIVWVSQSPCNRATQCHSTVMHGQGDILPHHECEANWALGD